MWPFILAIKAKMTTGLALGLALIALLAPETACEATLVI
jgi:hypothetical protein